MNALLRRLCARLDFLYERHPLLAMLIAILICFACEIAISFIGGDAMPPAITHIGGFSA
ncbi:hypothetical protein [Trinickia soli]|uniref:hypothetical protein n=1 Tax=Trinickia soli TaxID=380675 RepID=UPI001304A587|nr:hypothetical protein [Trinickia soli]CAB3644325.1 hypothetical protein LMG24076_00481 [Trinickia soli]